MNNNLDLIFVPTTNSWGPYLDGRSVQDGNLYRMDQFVPAYWKPIGEPTKPDKFGMHFLNGNRVDGPVQEVMYRQMELRPNQRPVRHAWMVNGQLA